MGSPDESTQALGPTMHDVFATFEDLCLLGNRERLQFLQLEYLHKTFALELIESVLTNYHKLFHKVCLSSPLPIQDMYASSCPQITLMFTAFQALTHYKTTSSPYFLKCFPSAPLSRLPSAATVSSSCSSNFPLGSRQRPKSSSHQSSNSSVVSLMQASLGLGG
jgi:Guanine nucleotide exchange factor in Golgi transport N-terminal